MTNSHGWIRKRRRLIRCAGWTASIALAGVTSAILWFGPTQQFWVPPILIFVTAALWHPWMKREGGVPVLIYHSVTRDGAWLPGSRNIAVSPELFGQHLETLRTMGCTVLRTAELVEARRVGRPLGKRPVVIHFDDGYLDNWVAALPLLKRYGFPATLFVSTDFIESGNDLRPNLDDIENGKISADDLQWAGYLNWAELSALQASGLVDIEAHGVDHGRVVTGPRTVDVLTHENWRRHAWMQWRHMPGNKSGWFRDSAPRFEPLGTPVPQSASALAARSWDAQGRETQAAYENRVATDLSTAKRTLETNLANRIQFFCWPFNETNDKAHELALKAGFVATTGGNGENRPGEDPTIISRYHVVASAFGWSQSILDGLLFRARVRLYHGNYYWGLLVIPLNAAERIYGRFAGLVGRIRFGKRK